MSGDRGTKTSGADEAPLWLPPLERVAQSHLHHFAERLTSELGAPPFVRAQQLDYDALYQWSIKHPALFWAEIWRYGGVIAERRDSGAEWDDVVVGLGRMAPPDPVLGPRWFTGARLNFAENLLRHRDERQAIVAWNEQGRQRALTYAELYDQVARAAAAMRDHGIVPGDRVAAFMPNIPETIICMLAAASLGAIWSSCSPDFGVQGVLDRFGQIAPRILITADGHRYAGKEIDSLERISEIVNAIPAIERVVVVPYLREKENVDLAGIRVAAEWSQWLIPLGPRPSALDPGGRRPPARPRSTLDARRSMLHFASLPFDHPLYILFSSGTTGLPKCMVHGAGGTLLQHLKEHLLHTDLRREDRIFYFTTCGWMMWNWLVSALAVGSTLVLYDGAPMAPGRSGRPDLLWDMAEAERITVFGTSAKYLALAEKEGLTPGTTHELSALRTILSTGSPLAPPGFDYVYRDVKRDVCLSSISGGTDIISCFVLGNPTGPVWRGEIQARGLGMRVEVLDDMGGTVRGGPGELVCTMPFPSMPVAFWNDPDGSRYHDAYFNVYPGVWRHGDWAERTPHGGVVITGRSDATLNPGGVRIGTAEIYREVEQLPEVVESLVVGQEIGDTRERDVRIVLFVRLRDGVVLDDALRERIRVQVRRNTSAHHVPRVIVQVADIPRTLSGKITEIAVREVIHGRPVKNVDALANPRALELFRDLPALWR